MLHWISNLLMPILGTVSADLIWIVSIQEILDARKARDIGALDPVPYVVGLASTVAWLLYGACIQDPYVFWANFPGVCLMSFYCSSIMTILYERASTPEGLAKYHRVEAMFMVMVAAFAQVPLLFIAVPDHDTTTYLLGMVATAVNIMFYLSPCTVIVRVFMTRDASSLFLPMLLANGACSACWFIYGLFGLNDVWLYSTNAVGVLLQGSFIVARLWFGNEGAGIDHSTGGAPGDSDSKQVAGDGHVGGSGGGLRDGDLEPLISDVDSLRRESFGV